MKATLRKALSGDFGAFAEKSDRDFFALAMIGAAGIAPFSIHYFVAGRTSLALMTAGVVAWFIANGVALYRGRRLLPAPVVFLPVLGVLAAAMLLRPEMGIFWAYPAILLFHFVLERRLANLYNASIAAATVPCAYVAYGSDAAIRVAVTVTLTILFANVFSYLTERQRRREVEDLARFRAQEKFISDVLDSIPVGLAMRDLEGRYVLVNRAWETFTGSRREDVIGRTVYERASKEEADRVMAADRETLARGPGAAPRAHAPALQDLVRHGRHYLITRTVMTDAGGRPRGVLAASVDMTDRYAMEEALANEQRRLELVVRAGNIGFLDWDGLTRTAYYSRRFKEILGYAGDADVSAWPDYFDMIHPEDRPRVQARFRRHVLLERSEEHETTEYRLRRADGSYVWVEAVGLSVRDAKGYVTRFIASIRDISERRAEEEKRLTEQRRLDLVVQATRVGIVDWDGRTKQVFYSPRFREILGYPPDADTSGWSDYFTDFIHPEDRERVQKRWREFILGRGEGGRPSEHYPPHQYRLRRADGKYVWVQASGVAVRDEKGYVLRWIAAVADITEQREQEEALRESMRLREEVERMSRHDLKTPLNAVIAVPRLLRERRTLSAEESELLSIVERAGYRILDLVNLSLDLFRMEQGRYVFRPQAIDLADLVEKVAADLESQAATKGVSIVIDRAPEAVHARGEELLCYSMLANLVKNAVEASPEGGTVTITLEANQGALVHIHNAGEVPEAVRERFFEKYSTAGKPEGVGLGTYSALLMARVQEGNITMRTSAGEGTTLTVRLAEATPEAPPAAAAAAGVHAGPDPAALPELDVLVVDDDEFNRLVMRRYLPGPPLRVDMAVNGRAALDALRRKRYDYVFLDLEMPVMSGYEAAERIRALEKEIGRAPSKLVAFSSNDDERSIRRALAAGCDYYLTKPAGRETLRKVLAGEAGAAPGPAQPVPTAEAPVEVDADLRPTLPAFFQSRREALDAIGAALARGERETVRRLAHKLAGSFSLYGFRWAAAECRAIERAAEGASAEKLAARLDEVRRHLEGARLEFVDTSRSAA